MAHGTSTTRSRVRWRRGERAPRARSRSGRARRGWRTAAGHPRLAQRAPRAAGRPPGPANAPRAAAPETKFADLTVRVQRITQAVANEVDRQDRDKNGQAGR